MEETKKTRSYYLDEDIILWLTEEGEKRKRSASYYLNELLQNMRSNKKR